MPRHADAANVCKVAEQWLTLTQDDLAEFFDARTLQRGRAYHRSGSVQNLAISAEGELLANVLGTEKYVTTVSLTGGKLTCRCTCPVGHRCKHAAAVIFEYLHQVAKKKPVAVAEPDDTRWNKLNGDDFDEEDDFDSDDGEVTLRRSRKSTQSHKARVPKEIQSYVQSLNQPQLHELVLSLVESFPELKPDLKERAALGKGDVKKLVEQTRRSIEEVTSQEAWYNDWDDSGELPDYGPIQRRLERLAQLGYHDHVVDLGTELFRAGMEQLAYAQDEGDTASSLSDCLLIVFRSLVESSMPASEKILFTVDACLDDDFDLLDDHVDLILEHPWPQAEWSEVADRLLAQQSGKKGLQRDTSALYRRRNRAHYIALALERAGRSDEILPFYESEAVATNAYGQVVDQLLQQQKFGEAERWARQGIEKTKASEPGTAMALAAKLCELAKRRKQWDVVAAHSAQLFFEQPSISGFNELLSAARKAKCELEVRQAALAFLETGLSPLAQRSKQEGQPAHDWPLPIPEELKLLKVPSGRTGPHLGVLLEMALAEKQNDEVLKWYDWICGHRQSVGWGLANHYADQVAEALKSTHPERSLAIYRSRLDLNLGPANPGAYSEVARLMRRMRPIYDGLGRRSEWLQMLSDMRLKYKNRPRFIEELEGLEEVSIVAAAQKRR